MQLQGQSCKAGRLTDAYIGNKFNVRYNSGHMYKSIKSFGFSWITTRSKHPKQFQPAQNAFKKVSLRNDPSHST